VRARRPKPASRVFGVLLCQGTIATDTRKNRMSVDAINMLRQGPTGQGISVAFETNWAAEAADHEIAHHYEKFLIESCK
jgi:hypothetical protein